jgi:hypothetical protein
LLRQYISRDIFAEDRLTSNRCWYGYGYLSTFQRNEAFTKAYVQAFRDLYSKYCGKAHGKPYDPIYPDFVRNLPDVMNHMHRGRQRADALGVRYDLYCRGVIETLMLDKGNHQMPRPNQMGSDKAFVTMQKDLDKRLDAQARNCLEPGSDARFQADKYVGHPAQLAALRELERAVRTHVLPTGRLAGFLRDGWISEAEARARFPAHMVDGALTRGSPKFLGNGNGTGSAAVDHHPACFGYAIAPATSECTGCPVREDCARMVAEVDARQVAVTGSADPRAEHVRAEARKRKQRERARKTPQGLADAEAVRQMFCEAIPRLGTVWLRDPELVRLLREEECHGP